APHEARQSSPRTLQQGLKVQRTTLRECVGRRSRDDTGFPPRRLDASESKSHTRRSPSDQRRSYVERRRRGLRKGAGRLGGPRKVNLTSRIGHCAPRRRSASAYGSTARQPVTGPPDAFNHHSFAFPPHPLAADAAAVTQTYDVFGGVQRPSV